MKKRFSAKDLKLTIELVPETSWYDNLRKELPKSEWDKIRKKAYADSGYRCGICGAKQRLNCHEVWKYDDKRHVQKLLGFVALCDMCHHVKHIGMAGILSSEGKLDIEKVVKHFMKVNQCSRKSFEEYKNKVFKKWSERSGHKWRLDFGEFKNLFQDKNASKKGKSKYVF